MHDRPGFRFCAICLLALLAGFFGCAGSKPPDEPKAALAPAPATPAETPAPAAPLAVESASPPGAPVPSPVPAATPDDAAPGTGTLTLDRAVREALAASPELEQIEHRIQAAGEQVRQAEASFYPRLVLSEDFNRTDNPVYAIMNVVNQRRFKPTLNFNNPGEQQNYSAKIQGDWLLFEGGSRWFDRKAALGVKRSVEDELKAARNSLVARVAETYYRWLNALEFIAVAEKSLESARTDERLGEARVRAETALKSELLRLKVRTAEARDHLLSSQTGARKLQAAMERLLARSVDPSEVPAISPGSVEDQGSDVAGAGELDGPAREELVRKALERRPEMAAMKALVDAAGQRVNAAKGGFLPRIGANLSSQRDSEQMGGTAAESWMLGIQASWPIFEGGITYARTREAQARLKEAEARGKQLRLDIALEVTQSALALREAVDRVQVAEERARWAEKALDEVRNLYRNQVVGVDGLLQAEVAWTQAEVSRAGAVFDARIARAVLRQSLGDFADGILSEPL